MSRTRKDIPKNWELSQSESLENGTFSKLQDFQILRVVAMFLSPYLTDIGPILFSTSSYYRCLRLVLWLRASDFTSLLSNWLGVLGGGRSASQLLAPWVLLILHFSSSWIHLPLNRTSFSFPFPSLSFFIFLFPFLPSFPLCLGSLRERDDGNVAESNYPPHPIPALISCAISNTPVREGSGMWFIIQILLMEPWDVQIQPVSGQLQMASGSSAFLTGQRFPSCHSSVGQRPASTVLGAPKPRPGPVGSPWQLWRIFP